MMPPRIVHIELESEKRLTIGQELDLLRAAHKRTPTVDVTKKLVKVLVLDDQFEEAIALLEGQADRNYRDETFLAISYLSRETHSDDLLALDAACRAFVLSDNDKQRAAALAAIGKCEKRLEQVDQAKSTLRRALAYDPHNKDACKRLAAIMLEEGDAEALLAWTDSLMAQGVDHARLFGARVLGFARKGDVESARRAEGFENLHRTHPLDPPPGWDSIDEFNAALATELVDHPAMRYDRYGSASESTWRIENPSRSDTPLFKALITQIIKSLSVHVSALEQNDHPWTLAVPEKALLRNWCVITESTGLETWHVHQFGWLSGVYYVQVPDVIAHGVNKDGCLAFGLPQDLVGEDVSAQFGQHIVRPKPGMVLTFPSHIYHRTFAHGAGEKRICVAFDVRPL